MAPSLNISTATTTKNNSTSSPAQPLPLPLPLSPAPRPQPPPLPLLLSRPRPQPLPSRPPSSADSPTQASNSNNLKPGDVANGPESEPSTANIPRQPATTQQQHQQHQQHYHHHHHPKEAWTPATSTSTAFSPLTSSHQSLSSHDKRSLFKSLRKGERVRVTLEDGSEFEGILTSSTASVCRLRMVHQRKIPATSTNGNNQKEYSTMSISKRDAADVTRVMGGNSGKGDAKANGNSGGFRTDAAISSSRSGRERTLTPWVAPTGSDSIDLNLETTSTSGGWDQFAANERQFGIKSTYDENIYTTAIDKSHPQYKERMAHADKKAREIERSPAATAHVAEERKMDYGAGDDAGGDEEDKYSGVKRQDFPPTGNRENKYTPPARRAPAGNASVKGAPVDPAIISSQLKTQKAQPAPKAEDSKGRAASKAEALPTPTAQPTESKPESKGDTQKPAETKPANQNSTPLRPSAATSRTISPQAKDGRNATPSATSTVERDVLKEFKTFAHQQRQNAEKVRSSKAKADKEVKLIELKKFADSFKLPTPVPVDLISIIAKDPAKQREIQEKAQRDAAEVAKRKADEAAAKEKKGSATKDSQPTTTAQPSSENRAPRPVSNVPAATGAPSGNSGGRHQGGRNYGPSAYPSYPNNRSGPQHMPQTGRLTNRIRALESQKAQGQEVRMPPTGPANAAADPSYARRMALPSHMGGKLNPNSHEFRPSAFAPTFSPNGHPSAGSSPRSAINHANESHSGIPHAHSSPVVITKKKKAVDPKKCDILSFVKAIQPPETKNWNDNDGLRPSYDTPPTWRSATDDEKPDSTMRLSYDEYFERQPFNTQPTPNPPHLIPQHVPHQHQLPLHMQHGALNVGPRHSPHVPPVPMHAGQHGPVPHVPFNGDDHRMMHSNSSQSFSSPRMSQVPMAYPAGMNTTPQMPYNQHVMPSFMAPGAPQLGQFNRSLSNNPQYMPQQPGAMGGPMMMQPPFIGPQGMVAGPPQMHMYPGGQAFMPPGATPQPMPGTNGYPSPGGRPAAPMMVPQGSQQGQPMFAQSPSMQYQQPFAPQPGQLNMRAYSNAGPQQFGTSPQQIHHYGGPPHRNGSNNFNKNYQGHNHHHGSQGGHAVPTGPQGRASDGPDEAK